MTEETNAEALPIDYAQLSQIRVPLDQAGEVFAQKDARGRTPIVLVPENPSRIRNAFVIGGVLVLVAGFAAGALLGQWVWLSLTTVLGLGLIVFGVYRSFLVRVPEGTTALLSRAGRFVRTLEAGSQIVPPWYAVSHLVTRREIPYDVPAVEALTKDHVRASVDTLITFTIRDPYRFVFSVTADDFDAILLAACLDAIRGQVRRLAAVEITGLTRTDTGKLRQRLNVEIEPYGVEIQKINVTDARPPDEFLRSLESQQLAAVQREEQDQRQALAQRIQANVEALARQKAIAEVERDRELLQAQVQQAETRRKIAQLEARTEDLRLSALEERLQKYPQAAAYELQRAQLEIARALAGNTRAVLQIGDADGILRAYVMRESLKDGEDPGLMGLAEQAGAVPGLELQVDASPDEKVEG